MRKIIATAFVSLDGVMQAPGGPAEDQSGGFDLGGWAVQYSDQKSGAAVMRMIGTSPSQMTCCLGARRTTFGPAFGRMPRRTVPWTCDHKGQQVCDDERHGDLYLGQQPPAAQH